MDGAHASRSKENIYMSSWGSSIGWRPCIMKQRLLVRIPLSPLLCGHVKKRKKKKKKNIYIYCWEEYWPSRALGPTRELGPLWSTRPGPNIKESIIHPNPLRPLGPNLLQLARIVDPNTSWYPHLRISRQYSESKGRNARHETWWCFRGKRNPEYLFIRGHVSSNRLVHELRG
jgi:hypothetical protein